ncbi:hypothetical protein PoB_001108100 [Plakobranchus ocellatus]|uniref:Uncharacterized protein n=1 Tax=Plakobranchus ocellatus TaxID=259542 RepID=A0AAV3YB67_9GAST|nr:hypothetical protein PoB_001108100 [Plakobranchus ocellatus]
MDQIYPSIIRKISVAQLIQSISTDNVDNLTNLSTAAAATSDLEPAGHAKRWTSIEEENETRTLGDQGTRRRKSHVSLSSLSQKDNVTGVLKATCVDNDGSGKGEGYLSPSLSLLARQTEKEKVWPSRVIVVITSWRN